MSAEGKKKRGEGGVSNAKHIPFRYGGHNAQWKRDGATHPKRGKPEPGGAFDKPLKGLTYEQATRAEGRG